MNTDKIYAEQIANEYSQKEATKVKKLRKLDAKAKNPANIFAFTFGIISALILGTGMSLVLGAIGSGIGAFIAGIVIGVVGIVCCCVNYPIYKKIREHGKNKYGSDIMLLAKEICDEEQD